MNLPLPPSPQLSPLDWQLLHPLLRPHRSLLLDQGINLDEYDWREEGYEPLYRALQKVGEIPMPVLSSPVLPLGARLRPHWIAFEGNAHAISQGEYDEACAHAEDYDFFLDATSSGSKLARAGRRGHDGVFSFVDLSRSEAEALGLLMMAGPAPLRAGLVHGGQDQTHVRFVDRARAKVDLSQGRCKWKFFSTADGDGREKAYAFKPPPGSRTLLLCRPQVLKKARELSQIAP